MPKVALRWSRALRRQRRRPLDADDLVNALGVVASFPQRQPTGYADACGQDDDEQVTVGQDEPRNAMNTLVGRGGA
jgi:hypothetical protein